MFLCIIFSCVSPCPDKSGGGVLSSFTSSVIIFCWFTRVRSVVVSVARPTSSAWTSMSLTFAVSITSLRTSRAASRRSCRGSGLCGCRVLFWALGVRCRSVGGVRVWLWLLYWVMSLVLLVLIRCLTAVRLRLPLVILLLLISLVIIVDVVVNLLSSRFYITTCSSSSTANSFFTRFSRIVTWLVMNFTWRQI